MPIRFYSKSETFSEFSNFSLFGIAMDGRWWPTTEHYFQAQKFTDPAFCERIATAATPQIAKKLSNNKSVPVKPDWDQLRNGVMRAAVYQKFRTHPQLAELLLSTGDEPLIEATQDDYWGVGEDGNGQNQLGRLLEDVRQALRREKGL